MTKIREYSKAIAALLGAVATFLVSVGAPPEWSAYLGSAVAIITGLATFGIPNFPSATAPERAVTTLQDVQAQLDAAKNTAASNLDSLTQQAINNVTKLQQAIGQVPGGSLVEQVIGSLPFPKL